MAQVITAHGKWKEVTGQTNEWAGTCQKCLQLKPAVELTLKRLPFGRGEQWRCKECML